MHAALGWLPERGGAPTWSSGLQAPLLASLHWRLLSARRQEGMHVHARRAGGPLLHAQHLPAPQGLGVFVHGPGVRAAGGLQTGRPERAHERWRRQAPCGVSTAAVSALDSTSAYLCILCWRT